MAAVNTTFDIDEILHLAAYAIDHQQTDKALSLAKTGAAQHPESGEIIYLLGTLYAEIGMYDKAKEHLSRSISSLDNPDPATFQLGLLYATSGQTEEALQAWQRLDHLDEDHYFRLFSKGILALGNDELASAEELLRLGIQRNNDIPALNSDMEGVLNKMSQVLPEGHDEDTESDQSHFLLSGYSGRKKS